MVQGWLQENPSEGETKRGEEGEETLTTQPTLQAETLQNLNDDPDVEDATPPSSTFQHLQN